MGTSKGYEAPTSPQWGDLKTQVTHAARDGRPSGDLAGDIVRNYIHVSNGRGTHTRSNSLSNKSASTVARNIASFFSLIGQYGLRETLRRTGLEFLQGKSSDEILLTLLDYLGGSSSTINDVDARNALSSILDDLFDQAEDYEEIEMQLQEQASNNMLEAILHKFFGQYIFEQFCRTFYERLVARVGEEKAEAFLEGICDYINSRVDDISTHQELGQIDWNGEQGLSITNEILEDTFEIYGG